MIVTEFDLNSANPVIQKLIRLWWYVFLDPEPRASLIAYLVLKSKNVRVALELERLSLVRS